MQTPRLHELKPCFNFEDEKRTLSQAQRRRMVDVRSKRVCTPAALVSQPYFEGKKGGIRCKKHKGEGMEQQKSKRCVTAVANL